jgi:hypothetical protein
MGRKKVLPFIWYNRTLPAIPEPKITNLATERVIRPRDQYFLYDYASYRRKNKAYQLPCTHLYFWLDEERRNVSTNTS